jgi:benzodiazapine receptor
MSFFYAEDDPKRAERRPLLIFVVVTLAVGAVASIFSEPAIPAWYAALSRPSYAPPGWLFAPIWTALYLLMAGAAWRVWRVAGSRSIEISAYGTALGLIFAWSTIFFGLHRLTAGFAAAALLAALSFATLVLFARRDRIAALLFAPFLAWTAFAAILNYALMARN